MVQIDKAWLFETSVMEPYFFGKIDGISCDLKDERTIELLNIDFCEYKLTEVAKASIKWTANFGGEDNGILRTLGKQEYTYEFSFNLPLYNGRIVDDMAGRQFSILCEARNGQRFVVFAQFEAKDISVENEQQTRVVLSSARTSAKRFNVLSINIVDIGITIDCDEVFSSLNNQNQMYFDYFPTTNIPTNLHVSDIGLNYLVWDWGISLGASGYQFLWGTDPNNLDNDVSISGGSTTSYRIEGLDQDTTYHAKIRAIGDYSNSLFTAVVSGTTNIFDSQLPVPTDLNIDSLTFGSITVSCTSQSGGSESGFEWELSDTDDFSNILQTNNSPSGESVPQTTFSFNETGILYIRVRADGSVPSDYSETLSFNAIYDFGLALYFNGITDEVGVNSSLGNIIIENEFTLSIWFNLKSVEVNRGFLFRSSSVNNGAIAIQVNSPSNTGFPGLPSPAPLKNTLSVVFTNGMSGATNRGYLFKEMELDSDRHNVTFTRSIDPSNSNQYFLKMYIDGIEEMEEIQGYDRFPSQLSSDASIGSGLVANTKFEGALDEISISKEFITPDKALEIYNGSDGSAYFRNNSNVVALWDFNSLGAVSLGDNTAISNNIEDVSGNGHNGTMNGFAKTGVISNWEDF